MESPTNPWKEIDKQNFSQDTVPEKDMFAPPQTKSPMPLIAGILLIIAGILALFMWITPLTFDASAIESMIDPSQLQQIDPSITIELIQQVVFMCSIIGCILGVFLILGGILAMKRKLWGLSLTGNILGLFTIGPALLSSILAFVALIILIVARKEFKPSSPPPSP